MWQLAFPGAAVMRTVVVEDAIQAEDADRLAFGWVDRRGHVYLAFPPGESLEAYGVALHELGHVAFGHVRRSDTTEEEVAHQEDEAWRWARAHARWTLESFRVSA